MSSKTPVIYTTGALPEYQGNPLIEALPPIEEDADVLRSMFSRPRISPEERSLSSLLRKKCLTRLESFVCPTPTYLEFHRAFEDALLAGYCAKNPFSPTTGHWLYYLHDSEPVISPAGGPFKSKARVTTVIGESGTGKSTMIETVLGRYQQVIEHKRYGDDDLPIRQLVYVYVECPSSASVTALCKAILASIDRALGTDYSDVPGRASVGDYEDAVERAVRNSFLGGIIVDEFQNMSVQRSGGQKGLVAFLLRLVNNSGVPFVAVGTPDMEDLIGKTLRTSRRFESGGVVRVLPLDRVLWDLFVERLWEYQWTTIQTPLTKVLSAELLGVSKGIHDFAIRTFTRTQREAIDAGHERITDAGLREAFRLETQFSFSELESTAFPPLPNHRDDSDQEKPAAPARDKGQSAKSGTEKVTPDIDQVQHPEFETQITRATGSGFLLSDIDEPEFLRSLCHSDKLVQQLESSGCLLLNPLELQEGTIPE